MDETDRIAEALARITGVASVTRGWPKQAAKLPCVAVNLAEQSAADTRDDAVYLTRHVYTLRVFAPTMAACDALKEPAAAAMEALGYTLGRSGEADGEAAQLILTFHKLD